MTAVFRKNGKRFDFLKKYHTKVMSDFQYFWEKFFKIKKMVPRGRIGLPTQRFSVSCSTTELPWHITNSNWHMVGVDGLEPSASPLSEVRSNQLSYTPIIFSYGLQPVILPDLSGRSNQLSYTPICKKTTRREFYTNSDYKIKPISKKTSYTPLHLAF